MVAPQVPQSVVTFVDNVTDAVINPLLALLFAGALVYFILGLMKLIFSSGNTGQISEGKSHMIWGLVGMAIMVSVYGILQLVLATFGVAPPPNTL
jgi:hypothetical protein